MEIEHGNVFCLLQIDISWINLWLLIVRSMFMSLLSDSIVLFVFEAF
jgi:hypothetical protein